MSVNGIGSNYCYMGAVANHVQEKVSETNAGRKVMLAPMIKCKKTPGKKCRFMAEGKKKR